MEDAIKRIPPNSLEAEQSVIGSMIMDKEAIATAVEQIDHNDFYHPNLKIIFDSILELYHKNQPVDIVTLQDLLKSEGKLETIGGLSYLSKLAMSVPSYVHAKEYAGIVKEKSILRKLIRAGQEIVAENYDNQTDVEANLESAEVKIFNIAQNTGQDEFTSIGELINPTLDTITAAHKNKGDVTGVSSGFPDLDTKTAGLQKADLILLAARPSMGKTAFALNIAQNAAIRKAAKVAIFSLEMSKQQLVSRMLCSESSIDAQKVRTGRLEDGEWLNLVTGANILATAPIYIDDTAGLSVAQMRGKCRKLKMDKGLDLIIIDYLQLMSGSSNARSESRQQEISEISRSLKALAREMEAPVVALSQLSRACEVRADHRPMLSDLRESGAIEQDADVVMFLYRDEYYHEDTEKKGIAELIIAKQRNGPTGTIELGWINEYTKFVSVKPSSRADN